MTSMRGWLVASLLVPGALGCGGQPARTVLGNHASYAATSCADAAAILRGRLYAGDTDDAGRGRDDVIESACRHDRWSGDVLACIGGEATVEPCLARLSSAQHEAYDAAMAQVAQIWGGDEYGGAAYGGDAYGGAAYGGAAYGGVGVLQAGGLSVPPLTGSIDTDPADCTTLAKTDPNAYPPALPTDADLTIALPLRARAIEQACETQRWAWEDVKCLSGANPRFDVATCLDDMEDGAHADLTARLADADALAKKVIVAQRRPAGIDCQHAVTGHYADARWDGKLDVVDPGQRTHVIAESRAKMLAACRTGTWDASRRACLSLGGGALCLPDAELTWGFPAAGVLGASGIADCDLYGAVVQRAQACAELSSAKREQYQHEYEWALSHTLPASADRADAARGCRTSYEHIVASATAPCQW